MKWSDVEITDKNNNLYTGEDALRFVKDNCKPFANRITDNGLIEVNAYSPGASTNDKDVRSVLFSKLQGKGKILRFLTGDLSQRADLPLARGVSNAFNVTRAKLKVQFMYKQHP